MEIELNRKELETAIQDYIFKKLGNAAYIDGFKTIAGNSYVSIDCVVAEVKE
ncbi:hypothetical protein [Virgibacillus profundi]|uniref:hypothetical protein n=1 Tax=Virgibacillus profundi TaxID=2024555 RepID=UPI0013FD2593|nr:hypothetical protein [Virgibacillus profundi]